MKEHNGYIWKSKNCTFKDRSIFRVNHNLQVGFNTTISFKVKDIGRKFRLKIEWVDYE